MKKLFFFASFSLIVFLSTAQNATLQWAKGFSGASPDIGRSVAVDASGNVYTTGYFQGTVDFNPNAGVANLTSAGGNDLFISKLDATGNFVWAKSIGSASVDIGHRIVVDGSGNIYVTGYFQGTADFDPNAGVTNLTSAGNNDISILKMDPAGNLIWAKNMGGALSDAAYGIAVDASGNVYTTGSFQGTADFDPNAGVANLISAGGNDIFISKLDMSGNYVWSKRIGGANVDVALGIHVDLLGNIYTTGNYQGATGVDFDPNAGVLNLISAGGTADIFITKLDAAGNLVWAKSFWGNMGDTGNGITADASGNVYTTGYFEGTADFDPNAGTVNIASLGNRDVFISKLDVSGNFVWAKTMGAAIDNDVANDIAIDAMNNIYTTGGFRGTVDFDPGPGVFNLSTAGASMIFISKLDAAGNFAWAKRLGGFTGDYGFGIAVDASDNVYTTGYFQGTADFDPNAATFNLISGGSTDTFVHKMGQCAVVTTTLTGQNNLLCNGSPIGSATVNVSGGTGFTYTWSPSGGNTSIASGLSAGTYSCLINNSCGSTATQTVLITQPPALSLTAVANNPTVCAGNSSTLTANGTGGTGIKTYTWVAGPTNSVSVVNPTTTTVYTINISDANNCTLSRTVSVTTNSLPIITVNSGSICSGNSFTIVPSGASTYTYQGGGAVKTPTATTSYTVTGTSAAGCVSSSFATSNVTVNATPTITVNSGSICSGNSFTIVPSGANTYTFQGGSAIKTPTANASYTVVGTSTAGCVSSSFATSSVTVSTTPTITVNNGSICSGNSFTIIPSGASTYTFQGGGAVKTPTSTTSYTVTGTSAAGCVSSSFATSNVTVNATPTITVNSGSICSGNSFTIVPSGASTYTFQGGSAIKTPTANASYTVTGTSAAGCVSSSFATSNVTVNTTPTITVNSGSICSGNSFTIVPSGASTYTFQGGGAVKTPTATTSYTVTGTSAAGCISSSFATSNVTVSTTPTITVNSGSICSGNSFTIVPSGASTYTFSSGSAIVNPTTTTSYSVSGTSSAGCVSSSFATSNVTVNATPTITVNSGSICSGNSFTIVPSGASTYTFSSGSAIVSPTATTNYSVSGTSTAGCVSSVTSNVTVNNTPTISVASGAICPGNSFTLSPSGANTFTFSSGSAIVTPTATTSYSISGTSIAGCVSTVSAVATITVAGTLTITITGNNSVCLGQAINLTGGGATTYTWSTGATTSTIAPTPTINTTYSITGASGSCSNTAVKSITVNPLPTITATTNNTLLCVGQTATLTANGASTYTWNPGGVATAISVSPTVTANYTVVGTDANGCENSSVFTQSVSACTGFAELSSGQQKVIVYPNPTNSTLNIKTEETIETVTVYNLLGAVVLEEKNNSFSVEQLPAGVYTLKIKTVNGIGTTRFVKE